MRYVLLLPLFLISNINLSAQTAKNIPLPPPVYVTMRDSSTSVDVVFLQGKGGSISIEGKNVQVFNALFENETAQKKNVPQAGTIMWEINGREYLSGNFFLGDSTGYVVINKNGREYVNKINGQGNSFFKSHINK